jgi:hypothetical protein
MSRAFHKQNYFYSLIRQGDVYLLKGEKNYHCNPPQALFSNCFELKAKLHQLQYSFIIQYLGTISTSKSFVLYVKTTDPLVETHCF